jgi:hypothetical protein
VGSKKDWYDGELQERNIEGKNQQKDQVDDNIKRHKNSNKAPRWPMSQSQVQEQMEELAVP